MDSDTRKKVNVAKALVHLFVKDEERTKNLTAADEAVRGLTFDQYNENVSCKVMRGVTIADFPTVVASLARRFSIPSEVKDSLLEGQYADDMQEIVIDFKFKKGETGGFIYGRVATVKHGGKIDLAYSMYSLQFKISPTVTRHEQKQKFLCFTIGTKVWHESRERNLSHKEKDLLKDYFMIKAINEFRSEYAPLLEN